MTKEVVLIGTVISDHNQQILDIDDRFCEIVGRERASLIGKQALSFTHNDDIPINRPALDKLAHSGPGFTIVKRYVQEDGCLIWVKNHVTRISDGNGVPLLCATTQLIDRPFGSERLIRNYKAAQRLCSALVSGRRRFTPEVIWGPAAEALLWLYRAEIEGLSLSVERLAALTGSAPSVMIRWVKLLQERGLLFNEQGGPLCGQTCVRISAVGEQKLDGLLADLTP